MCSVERSLSKASLRGEALYVTWHLAHCVWNPYCELAQNATHNDGACMFVCVTDTILYAQLHAFNHSIMIQCSLINWERYWAFLFAQIFLLLQFSYGRGQIIHTNDVCLPWAAIACNVNPLVVSLWPDPLKPLSQNLIYKLWQNCQSTTADWQSDRDLSQEHFWSFIQCNGISHIYQ